MKRQKQDYEERFAKAVQNLTEIIWEQIKIDSQPNTEQIKEADEKLTILKRQHPGEIKYPTWPFDFSVRLSFILSQVVTLGGFIITLVSTLTSTNG